MTHQRSSFSPIVSPGFTTLFTRFTGTSTNADAAAGTKVQTLTQRLAAVAKYRGAKHTTFDFEWPEWENGGGLSRSGKVGEGRSGTSKLVCCRMLTYADVC